MTTVRSMLVPTLLLPALLAGPAQAQIDRPQQRHWPRRPIRPRPPLVKTEAVRLDAHIVDGVCDTRVAMTFRNDGGIIGEKILVFPLPRGAAADKLEMHVNGKLETGEILDKNKARGIYESIVRRRRDPALLEYMGRDLLRLRVFPIPPRGKQDVEVRFRLLLPESGGLHTFEFPARAVEGGRFSMDIKIDSRKAIKNVYSPVQGMDVVRKDDHHARASYECKGRPPKDPVLFYGLSDRDFGLNLLTYRKQGQDGYFVLMLAPKRDWKEEKELAKSITFVLDTSGSMQGEKIQQAKNALRFFLKSLKTSDFFNVVPFSTEARPFAQGLQQATPDKIDAAFKFAGEIEARGGTNIEEAMRFALAAKPAEGTVPMVVFLTDGLPTVGVTGPKEILQLCGKSNTGNARVFAFGVGNDVNTYLLDKLSGDSGGTRDYVKPGENLEVKVSALFEKLAHPIMTDLALVCDQVQLSRMVPGKLPDLFRGSRLVVAGRYTKSGAIAIRLTGKVGGQAKEFVYDANFPSVAVDHDFVATLWAQRRLGQLLDAIRLSGRSPELENEIRRIGKEHGIVTPYTSHLIVEEGENIAYRWRGRRGARGPGAPGPLTPQARARVQDELRRAGVALGDAGQDPAATAEVAKKSKERLSTYGRVASGKQAVGESTTASRLMYLKTLDSRSRGRLWTTQRIGGRLFHLVAGVWIDAGYQPAMEKNLRKVEAFSDAYFELLRQRPQLAKILSFSTAMVVVIGRDEAVEIVAPE